MPQSDEEERSADQHQRGADEEDPLWIVDEQRLDEPKQQRANRKKRERDGVRRAEEPPALTIRRQFLQHRLQRNDIETGKEAGPENEPAHTAERNSELWRKRRKRRFHGAEQNKEDGDPQRADRDQSRFDSMT